MGSGIANVLLNLFTLGTLVWVALILRRLLREWRYQHGLRTDIATVYGMIMVLVEQNAELSLETQLRLYLLMEQRTKHALESLDVGTALNGGGLLRGLGKRRPRPQSTA